MNTQKVDPRTLRAGLRARQRAAAIHLFNPRVTLIDLGWKIQDGKLTDTLAVRFHVQEKPTGPTFEAFADRSPALVLPSSTDLGFPVDYIEASYRSQLFDSSPAIETIQRDGYFNPIQGGISISNEWEYGYGTLGGLVKDHATGDPMILSAWHVLALSAYTRPGLRILQPGLGDGGSYRNTVARFTRHGMLQGIDAAVAKLEGPRTTLNEELQIGPVTGVTEPVMDMRLIKSGRASQITQGIISGVEGERPIWYGGLQRKIRHIVHIVPPAEGGEVSRAGDSGSWWLEEGTNKAAALHIAGEDHPEYALAISMPRVLEALDVVIE
jgi:endonuclease G, mitochondrial